MKRVEALIPSHKLREVRDAILGVGVGGLFITSGRGRGKGKRPEVAVASQASSKIVMEYNTIESVLTVVEDSVVEKVVSAILDVVSTGSMGDGKICVSSVDEFIDIGTKRKESAD